METIEQLRIVLSILLFVFGCYFVYDLFTTGFDLLILLLVPASFYGAYLIWPNDREETGWLDIIGEIIEFPIRAAILAARTLARTIRTLDD